MDSELETKICNHLRCLLSSVSIGSDIIESEEFRKFQTGLEHFSKSDKTSFDIIYYA
jgi:hypothetical protein